MAPQNPTPKKPRWRGAFLAALAQTGNVTAAARAAHVDRTTAYDLRAADPEFAALWRAALDEAADLLEQEARRRAHDGLVRYKFDRKGQPLLHPTTGQPYCELEYSDTLLIFLLKGARPEKYRERADLNLAGKDGGPIQSEVKHDVAAELRQYADAIRALVAGELGSPPVGAVPPDGDTQPVAPPETP